MKQFFARTPLVWAGLSLAGFVTLLYFPLLFTNRVLANGDILLYFYPYRDYAAAMLRSGSIPLWNPYIFMGVPFLANPQAAVLYPLHWPLIWLPVTQQIYWSAASHTWLLGFGLLLLLRHYGLSVWASLAGGVVLAGCGFYGGLLGHINQMNAAAWLPWAIWILARPQAGDEQTRFRQRRAAVAWLALIVALMILAGHTQTAYINLFGVGVWVVCAALLELPSWQLSRTNLRLLWTNLLPALLVYGLGCALGALLAAAQLLPTLELNGLGLRQGGLSYGEATSFSLHPLRIIWSLLPSYGLLDLGTIFGVGYTEFMGYIGLTGLGLALLGLWRSRGRVCQLGFLFGAMGLFLAFGRWNPVYYLLYWLVPGFDLFRVPARWMMLYSLGMAVLAGLGIESLVQQRARRRWVALTLVLITLLAGELLLAAQALPHRQLTAPQAVYEARTAPAHLLTDPARTQLGSAAMGRFLGMSTITYDPGDMADWRRLLIENSPSQLDQRAFEQFIIGLKIQELVVPNLSLFWRIPAVDGFDGGVLPLQRYNQFLTLFVPPDELVPDGRLREQIKTMPAADLLGLLNVQYVITDKVRDLWFEDVFYDRQIGARLTVAQPSVELSVPRPFAATHLDLIGYVEGEAATLANTEQVVLTVTMTTEQESLALSPVTAGDQPGAQLADPTLDSLAAQQSGAVIALRDVDQARQEYRVRVPLPSPVTPTTLQLHRLDTPLDVVIQAATLYDERTKMFVPLLPSDRGQFALAHSGDVKIYENQAVRPRAYLVHQVVSATQPADALTYLRTDDRIRAGQAAVIQGERTLQATATASDTADLIHYAPEEIVVRTKSQDEALLVLSDTDYPGWQATIDDVPAPIYPANFLFRGVFVPAGEHVVRFVYQPASWRWGLWLSGGGLLLWLLLLGSFPGLRPRLAHAPTTP